MFAKRIIAVTAALLMLMFAAAPGFAQQETPGVQYVVQPGDTLTGIAARFGISVDALSDANGITNPNQLYAGQPLSLPGIDWVQGLLDYQKVDLGENFRTLSRRYHLDPGILARLSGYLCPSQLYAGSEILLPSGSGENLVYGRAAISEQDSVLQVAAEVGANPWMLVAENQLSGIWSGLAGDVIFLPGINDPGPGALPSPITMTVTHGNFVQGKTTVIGIDAAGQQLQITGQLSGKPLHFFVSDSGSLVSLQGIHVMSEPGIYPISINGVLASGEAFELSQMVMVNSGNYTHEKINVDPAYLDPVLDESEFNYIASLTAPVTPEKLWSGYFSSPTPFDIFINSYFGTRRSYNGSPYSYFHSGIDFGGGQGADVISPAAGRVVFAGPLEIRGNATVIDHGWGIYTGYWHQSELRVAVGDMVQEGQVIGLVGNTGRSSGAHLHWEIWAGGVQVEPYDWLLELFP
ncbi:MAG: peptidoglycan DD-metalloendopeptidase family protein [Chloroflexota bacterium]